MKPRLNIDVGELADEPEALVSLAHMVNVACGAHAGDERTSRAVMARARLRGVSVGAHPSYPDRANFGRVAMRLDESTLRVTLRDQLLWLRELGRGEGVAPTHVKLHGALYHAATNELSVARAVLDVTASVLGPAAVVGPPTGHLRELAIARGMTYLREGFADRRYRDDGTLMPRGEPGATLDDVDAVRAQVTRLAREGSFETLCVHGDGPHSVEFARAVREALG